MKTYKLINHESSHISLKGTIAILAVGLTIYMLPKIIEWTILLGIIIGDKL